MIAFSIRTTAVEGERMENVVKALRKLCRYHVYMYNDSSYWLFISVCVWIICAL